MSDEGRGGNGWMGEYVKLVERLVGQLREDYQHDLRSAREQTQRDVQNCHARITEHADRLQHGRNEINRELDVLRRAHDTRRDEARVEVAKVHTDLAKELTALDRKLTELKRDVWWIVTIGGAAWAIAMVLLNRFLG